MVGWFLLPPFLCAILTLLFACATCLAAAPPVQASLQYLKIGVTQTTIVGVSHTTMIGVSHTD